MLTSASKAGFSTETRTSAWAARWKIISGCRCPMSSARPGWRMSRRGEGTRAVAQHRVGALRPGADAGPVEEDGAQHLGPRLHHRPGAQHRAVDRRPRGDCGAGTEERGAPAALETVGVGLQVLGRGADVEPIG